MTLRANSLLVGAFALALLAAAADVLVAYTLGPAAAAVLPLGVVAAVLVVRDPLFGVCAGLCAIPLETFAFSTAGGGAAFTAAELLLILAGLSATLRLVFDRTGRPLSPTHRALAALVATMIIGIGVAVDPATAAKPALMWTVLGIVSVYVAAQDARRIGLVMTSLAFAGGVVGLIAVSGAGSVELQQGGAIAEGRAVGSFDQPNLLGFFLALCLPVLLVQAANGSLLRRALLSGGAAFAFAGLLFSLSRTSLVGTGLALVVLLGWPSFRRVAAVGLAILLVFALFNADALSRSEQLQVVSQRLATLGDRDAVDDGRAEMYANTPAIVRDHWLFGVGQANYEFVSEDYGIRGPEGTAFVHAHNIPLTIAAESGIPGLLAALVTGVLLFLAARRALRQRGSPLWPAALGVCAGLTTLAATGMGDYPLRANSILAVVLVEIGLLVGLGRLIAASEVPGEEPAPATP